MQQLPSPTQQPMTAVRPQNSSFEFDFEYSDHDSSILSSVPSDLFTPTLGSNPGDKGSIDIGSMSTHFFHWNCGLI